MQTVMEEPMQTETTAPTIYNVPEENYAKLMEQIAKLQKRAKKLNSGAIEITELGHEDWPGYRHVNGNGEAEGRVSYMKPGSTPHSGWRSVGEFRRYFQIQVTGERPKLNGWQFAATIDAITDEDGKFVGNMLRTLPGFEIPTRFRDADTTCEHCGKVRNRKNTFIVKHEDGNWKQVGRQCIMDFTGHPNPEYYARYAELLMSLDELCDSAEDDDWLGGGGRGIRRHSVEMLLVHTACLVRHNGWKPKVFEIESTANYLMSWVLATEKDREKLDKKYAIEDCDKQVAKETEEWLEGLSEREGLNDYLYNLSVLGRAGAVEPKAFGFLASAIPTYLRTKDIETLRRKERLDSNHVGEVTKRMESVLTLKMKRYFDGDYGTKTMCKFHDEQGNVIVWWASSSVDLLDDTKVKAKFTVKKHDEYNGVKQTLVSRLAVSEVIFDPSAQEKKEKA